MTDKNMSHSYHTSFIMIFVSQTIFTAPQSVEGGLLNTALVTTTPSVTSKPKPQGWKKLLQILMQLLILLITVVEVVYIM